MVRPLTEEMKAAIIKSYALGRTYDEIVRLLGVSKGAITPVIGNARAEQPDIDDLRRLATDLGGRPIIEAIRGANFLKRLDDLNIVLDQLPQVIALIEKYRDDATTLLTLGARLSELEESTGKTYTEIVDEYSRVSKDLSERSKRVEALVKEERELQASIESLKRLTELQEILKKNRLSIEGLQRIIEDGLKLQNLGFSPSVAEPLANQLKELGSTPMRASKELARILLRGFPNLEDAIVKRESELKNLEGKLKDMRSDFETQSKQLEGKLKDIKSDIDIQSKRRKTIMDQIADYKVLLREQRDIHSRKMKDLTQEYEDRRRKEEGDFKTKLDSNERETYKQLEQLDRQISDRNSAMIAVGANLSKKNEDLESIRVSLEGVEKDLEKAEKTAAQLAPIAVWARIIEHPDTALPSKAVLDYATIYSDSLRKYVEIHPEVAVSSTRILQILSSLSETLASELRLVS